MIYLIGEILGEMKKIIIISTIIVAFCSLLGFCVGNYCSTWIVEYCKKDTVIAEEMVFDEPEIIEQYGGKLVIKEGTRCRVYDAIAYTRDLNGYEYIDADLILGNSRSIKVAISFEHGSEKTVYPATEIFPHSTDDYIIVFDVGKLESSQEVLEKYKQTYKRYNSRVNGARIIGIAIGAGIAMAISAIVILGYYKQNK